MMEWGEWGGTAKYAYISIDLKIFYLELHCLSRGRQGIHSLLVSDTVYTKSTIPTLAHNMISFNISSSFPSTPISPPL
jgi:hypothetical protein